MNDGVYGNEHLQDHRLLHTAESDISKAEVLCISWLCEKNSVNSKTVIKTL